MKDINTPKKINPNTQDSAALVQLSWCKARRELKTAVTNRARTTRAPRNENEQTMRSQADQLRATARRSEAAVKMLELFLIRGSEYFWVGIKKKPMTGI